MAKGQERGARGAQGVTTTEAPSSPGVLPVVRRRGRRRGAAARGRSWILGRRRGSCGTPWSTLSTLCALLARCNFSMHLCRRWWNSCRTSCISSTRSRLILSRLSKCPRSCLMMSEPLFATRNWRNSCGSADEPRVRACGGCLEVLLEA